MASFKEIRELLLLSFENNTISDEEFLLLSEQFKSKNPDFPYEKYLGFELDDMDESECLAEFRFQKRHIPLLADVLQLPDQFCATKDQFQVESRDFAFCWNGCHIPADIVIWFRALASPFRS